MGEKLWSYPEIKFVKVHYAEYSNEELAETLNQRFHNNAGIRTAVDVIHLKSKRSILDK